MSRGRWGYHRPKTRRLISVPGGEHRGNRTLGNPFLTLGLEWCETCRGEMDTDTEASHKNGVYVFKRTCRRCGRVLKSGVYAAPLVSDQKLPAMAVEWVTRPGVDRR